MRRLYSVILFVVLSVSLWGETPVRYRLSANAGSIIRGSIADKWIGNRPVLGAEFAVEFLPTGKWESLQWYNNASIGLAFNYLNLTNDAMLGQAFAPYVYLNIPLVKTKYFIFGLRPGIGVSFVDKTYYNTVAAELKYVPGSIQEANGAIGSHTNTYFPEAIYAEFPIKKGFSITASYGWYHISNGTTRHPNSGYNMFNGALGLTYFPDNDTYVAPETKIPHGLYDGKRWDVEMSISGGFRQAYFVDKNTFGTGQIAIAAHYRPWSIFKIGGGIDIFYDGYYKSVCDEFGRKENIPTTYFGKTYLSESKLANCFRMGVSIQPEFILGNFTAGLHVGVYFYDPIKNLEPFNEVVENGGKPLKRGMFYKYDITKAGVTQDGWLYTRVLLKYRCTKHFFVQLGMKSHLAKVEFIDAGLGVCF